MYLFVYLLSPLVSSNNIMNSCDNEPQTWKQRFFILSFACCNLPISVFSCWPARQLKISASQGNKTLVFQLSDPSVMPCIGEHSSSCASCMELEIPCEISHVISHVIK